MKIIEIISAGPQGVQGPRGPVAFPFSGSASVTGSFEISGRWSGTVDSIPIISSTASIDLMQSSFFQLTLASNATTHLKFLNLKPAQTTNIKIIQPTPTGSLTYSSILKFPSGIRYNVSRTGSAVDILSIITFDNTTIYATALKDLK